MQRAITIDIGNTWTKTCVFDGLTMLHSIRTRKPEPDTIGMMSHLWNADYAALCSVRKPEEAVRTALGNIYGERLFVLNGNSPLPIRINYSDPSALGADRIAAACGAVALFGNDALLVIDAGTAITADIVAGSVFVGGKISPGLRLRLESLHKSTGRLPNIEPDSGCPGLGNDTADCILAGTLGGLLAEIKADMEQAKNGYSCTTAILTGGHASLLARELGNDTPLRTIVLPELASLGLKCIIDYHENN